MGNEDQASGEDEEEHEVDRHLRNISGAPLTPLFFVPYVAGALERLRSEVDDRGKTAESLEDEAPVNVVFQLLLPGSSPIIFKE